jgi:ribosomal protein L12E/L44/L45/RPP1/RPP2
MCSLRGSRETAAAAPESEDPKEDEPKEEKQETAAAGLGSLFG